MPIEDKMKQKKVNDILGTIKGSTDKIDTRDMKNIKSGAEFAAEKKMLKMDQAARAVKNRSDDLLKTAEKAIKSKDKEMLKKIARTAASVGDKSMLNTLKNKIVKAGLAKKILSAVPFAGTALGIASALHSGDASAALPAELEVEALGPKKGSPGSIIESADATPAQRAKAIRDIIKTWRK